MFRNFYQILGVERTAKRIDIKKAYRKLALQWHPDKNKSLQAQSRFIEINQAYLILADEDAKQKYDDEYDRCFSKNQPDVGTGDENLFKDENLNEWSQNARRQAETYAGKSFEDFAKMMQLMVNEVGNQSFTALIYAASGVVSVSCLFSLIEGIRYGDYSQMLLSIIVLVVSIFAFVYTSRKYEF